MEKWAWIGSLIVPIIFLAIGAAGKKLAKGDPWNRSDWYLGPELALSLVPTAMLYVLEHLEHLVLAGQQQAPNQNDGLIVKIAWSILFAAVSLGLYIGLLSLHQDWEHDTQNPKQIWLLGVLSNGAAAALFVGFVYFVQG
jgi:hypothetical protein